MRCMGGKVIADNALTVHIFSAMAQHERKLISERTKAALAQAKKRGVILGNPYFKEGKQIPGSSDTRAAVEARKKASGEYANSIREVITDIKFSGASSLRQIAAELNAGGFKTRRSKDWSATGVMWVLKQ
jgi:DNA invertase Pin-like site-specific DNA recombinase